MELPVSYWLSVCMRDFLYRQTGRAIAGRGSPANVVPIYFLPGHFVSVGSSWRSSGWEAAAPEGAGLMQEQRAGGCVTKSRCGAASASAPGDAGRGPRRVSPRANRDPRSFGLLCASTATAQLSGTSLFAFYPFPCPAKF